MGFTVTHHIFGITVADLGIDGRGAPPEVWALRRIGGLGAVPLAGVQGAEPRWRSGGEAPQKLSLKIGLL